MNFSIEQPPRQTGEITTDLEQLYLYLEELIDELEYLFSEVKNG